MKQKQGAKERSGSSVEALGATGQDEEHDPVRRILKQLGSCESTQCKLLLVMTRSHSPPACAELDCRRLLHIYAFPSCVKGGGGEEGGRSL